MPTGALAIKGRTARNRKKYKTMAPAKMIALAFATVPIGQDSQIIDVGSSYNKQLRCLALAETTLRYAKLGFLASRQSGPKCRLLAEGVEEVAGEAGRSVHYF